MAKWSCAHRAQAQARHLRRVAQAVWEGDGIPEGVHAFILRNVQAIRTRSSRSGSPIGIRSRSRTDPIGERRGDGGARRGHGAVRRVGRRRRHLRGDRRGRRRRAEPRPGAESAPPAAYPRGMAVCASCRTDNPEAARFCCRMRRRRCSPAVPSCGGQLPAGARFCPSCGAAVAGVFAAGRGAQGRHRPLRRHRRLHGPRRAARPRGRPRDARPVLVAAAHRARALRRDGREVHRRRCDGALRRAGGPRGRPRAGGAGGARRSATRSPS